MENKKLDFQTFYLVSLFGIYAIVYPLGEAAIHNYKKNLSRLEQYADINKDSELSFDEKCNAWQKMEMVSDVCNKNYSFPKPSKYNLENGLIAFENEFKPNNPNNDLNYRVK